MGGIKGGIGAGDEKDRTTILPEFNFTLRANYDPDKAQYRMGRLLASLAHGCGKTIDLGDRDAVPKHQAAVAKGLALTTGTLALAGLTAEVGGALVAGMSLLSAAAKGFGYEFPNIHPDVNVFLAGIGAAGLGGLTRDAMTQAISSSLEAGRGFTDKMAELAAKAGKTLSGDAAEGAAGAASAPPESVAAAPRQTTNRRVWIPGAGRMDEGDGR